MVLIAVALLFAIREELKHGLLMWLQLRDFSGFVFISHEMLIPCLFLMLINYLDFAYLADCEQMF